MVPTADQISVREVLAKYEAEFATTARAVENGEFALWIGSGVSQNAPNLGDLIERALEFLRIRAIDAATAETYNPALREALEMANVAPDDLTDEFQKPFSDWSQRHAIIRELWNKYSRVLDIRIKGKPTDFILWEAIDIRAAFANPPPPAAEHLCIAILVLEGAVSTIASGNWDGFIEAAIARLSPGAQGLLHVVVKPDQMRSASGRAVLLKFHGCITHATRDPTFREYLTGSQTQITDWPHKAKFAVMRNAMVNIATNQKALVVGLSIQDSNLQSIFSEAKEVNPWRWPCDPQAPGHVFCEDSVRDGQVDVLKVVYGDAYNDNVDAIHARTHLRAWGSQVLLALVLKLIVDKLSRLMEITLRETHNTAMATALSALLVDLRDHIADLAVGDRTAFTGAAIESWSRLLSLFRRGRLPLDTAAYETLSTSVPNELEADQNAQASELGRLGVALSLIQYGRADGLWELGLAAAPHAAAGALTVRGNRQGAPQRALFLVKSAMEAIRLEGDGAFGNNDEIVVHADDVWHRITRAGTSNGVRQPRSAPGRVGRVRTTHVSLGHLLDACTDADSLKEQFAAEMTL